MVEYDEDIVAWKKGRLLRLGGEMQLLLLLAPSLLLLSCSWPATDCTFIPEGFCSWGGIENLPASSKSPLSSAVVAKPKDGDDGGGGADLLMEEGDDQWNQRGDSKNMMGLNLQDGKRFLSLSGWPQARHSKAKDVDRLPHLEDEFYIYCNLQSFNDHC